MKATFSGHESFQCKSLWLKKGYDYAAAGKSFNDDYAVVDLGVGKNMVASIRYWLRAFGIIDESGKTTDKGDYLFGEQGRDPYIEDVGTQWLLHYFLVTTDLATLYHITFTEFNRHRHEFSKSALFQYIKRLFDERRFGNTPYNENTINRDIATLLKNYVQPDSGKSIDDFSAVLLDLHLIKRIDREHNSFDSVSNDKVHPLILLFAIIDNASGQEVIEYSTVLELSGIFGMTTSQLYDAFEVMHKCYPQVSFSNTAGEQLFVIKGKLNKWDVLDKYYTL